MFVECSVPTSSAKDVTIKKTRMCGDALTSLINNQICSGVFRLQGTVPFSHPKSFKKPRNPYRNRYTVCFLDK